MTEGKKYGMLCSALAMSTFFQVCLAGDLLVDPELRASYIKQASVWWPEQEANIANKDLFNGPPNPYHLQTHQTIDCDFVQPDPTDPIGGTTPKFKCSYEYKPGKKVDLKIKYDQQSSSALDWKNPNPEVYASLVSQRVLWALGFGSDQSVPLAVNCRGCPLEPWTYIQMVQGHDEEDLLSGWMNLDLVNSGKWNTTLPLVSFSSALAYIKMDKYVDGDAITWINPDDGEVHTGFAWPELYSEPTPNADQQTARDALSVLAAFLGHCDNFDGNQGFICLTDDKSQLSATKGTTCKGTPFLYIHDIGGSLGYGWDLRHKDFWPDYFDLHQWQQAAVWGNTKRCEVTVNGVPGCSWRGNLQVSEAGRALAARLLAQLTNKQIMDLFSSARAQLMRGESVEDWVTGFQQKMQSEVLGIVCK